MATLRIKKFDMSQMPPNCSIAIIAKRGSGKSILVRDILKQLGDIPAGLIIAPTDSMTKFYSSFFPELFIKYKFNTNKITKLLTRQKELIKRKNKGENIDPRVILVMDDCLAEKNVWKNDENIRTIFLNGRHCLITYILTMQYAIGVLPELRSNFDYIFLLAEDNVGNLKKMHENYAGIFDTFANFKKCFKNLTEDYGIMVINNRAGANAELHDKVFWYKVDINAPNKCKRKEMVNYHKKHFNPEWEETGSYPNIKNEQIMKNKLIQL